MEFLRRKASSPRARPAAFGAFLALALAGSAAAQSGFSPLSFFNKSTEKISPLLCASDGPQAAADDLLAANARYEFKHLRELFRIYRDRYGEAMESGMKLVHAVDRQLGDCADRKSAAGAARAAGAPPGMLAVMESEQGRACGDLASLLARGGWMDGSALKELVSDLSGIPRGSAGKNRAYVLQELSERLQKIASEDYDVSTLEGMHKLRRAIRSFLIEVEAFYGLTILDRGYCPIPRYQAPVSLPADVEPGDPVFRGGTAPIRIPDCLYRHLSKMVEVLGNAKDFMLWTEFLSDAALKSGAARTPEEARIYAENLLAAQPEAADAAQVGPRIYAEIRAYGILDELFRELRAQR